MARMQPVTSGEEGPEHPSLGQVRPTIAHWASGYGWVELAVDGMDRP
ncbi:MAG: hypothetical protein JO034_27505 [Singulisphaera sp.]|jgi:hypothetical protein|nr:hypothetical protein [Singulisphaera sp.]